MADPADPTPTGDRPSAGADDRPLPFPDSLCHRCGAPPKYVRTPRSIFLFCPIFRRYPPQPVVSCPEYVPANRAGG